MAPGVTHQPGEAVVGSETILSCRTKMPAAAKPSQSLRHYGSCVVVLPGASGEPSKQASSAAGPG
jgi:hypothetical protein